MVVLVNVIKSQGLEPLQFPTKFRSHSLNVVLGESRLHLYRHDPRDQEVVAAGRRFSEALLHRAKSFECPGRVNGVLRHQTDMPPTTEVN